MQMQNDFLPVIGFVATGIVVLAVIAVVLHRKAQRRAEQLGPAFELGTVRPAGPLSSGIAGLYRSYTCRYTIQYPSQYDRGGALLRIELHSPYRWSAERANVGSRVLVKIGLVTDLTIGDRELDEHFRFSADHEESLRSVFAVEKARESLHLLVADENFDSIGVRSEHMDIKWSPRNPKLDDDPDILRARLESGTAFAAVCGYSPRLDQ